MARGRPALRGAPMGARDPHRFVNDLDHSSVARLIDRLESRARDRVFSALFDQYVERLALPKAAAVLEVGCGTGAMLRRLIRSEFFLGDAIGIDQSPVFVAAADRYANQEGLGHRARFRVGDAHDTGFRSGSFDAVIAHTVVSHVAEPARVVREMARVLRPGGNLIIFDGDYGSLTFSCRDRELGRKMDIALAQATFNNPWIVRDIPDLLRSLGLQLRDAWGSAVAEIGNASYFRSFAEAYVPLVLEAGLLSEAEVTAWLAAQREAIEAQTFFAACNYYTYFAGHA